MISRYFFARLWYKQNAQHECSVLFLASVPSEISIDLCEINSVNHFLYDGIAGFDNTVNCNQFPLMFIENNDKL